VSTLSLEKRVCGARSRNVVHDVTIAVPPGEVTTLLGPTVPESRAWRWRAPAGASDDRLGVPRGPRTSPTIAREDTGCRDLRGPRGPTAVAQLDGRGEPDGLDLLARQQAASDGLEYTLSLFPELEKRWRVDGRLLSGGEQRWSCLRKHWSPGRRCWWSTNCRWAWRRFVVKRLVPTLADGRRVGVAVLLIEQFAHVALSLAKAAYGPRGWPRSLQRIGGRAHRASGTAALRLPAARPGRRHRLSQRFASGERGWPRPDQRVKQSLVESNL